MIDAGTHFLGEYAYPYYSGESSPCYFFSLSQFIHHFWVSTPSHALWSCQGYLLVLGLKAVHCVCWLSIACSLFTIDYLELLGIKQVYRYTVEPPNNGQFGDVHVVHCSEVVPSSEQLV